jgi:3-hydroxyisobutyrate dehydrogenase-like beta-hydroxyacid dehydrogenase
MNEGKFDFGFAVEWMRWDISICLAESRRNGASLPVTALVDAFYSEEVEKNGWHALGRVQPARTLNGSSREKRINESV